MRSGLSTKNWNCPRLTRRSTADCSSRKETSSNRHWLEVTDELPARRAQPPNSASPLEHSIRRSNVSELTSTASNPLTDCLVASPTIAQRTSPSSDYQAPMRRPERPAHFIIAQEFLKIHKSRL